MYSSTSGPLLYPSEEMSSSESDWGEGRNIYSNESLFWRNGTSRNETDVLELEVPLHMRFTTKNVVSIVVHSLLFIFSAVGNLTVLISLLRRRKTRLVFPPMDFLLLNLAIADLMVTFLMMPMEVAWSATVYWRGGNLLCKIMTFLRSLGLFLSSFVLVCLAADRYMAVKFPMQTLAGVRRTRCMILISWILAIFCSAPQPVLFSVQTHPQFTWYTNCVVYGADPTLVMYNVILGMFFLYLGPVIVIVVLYCGIVIELIRRHQECYGQMSDGNGGEGLRRSGIGNIGKAKERALKMTVIIAVIFFICWTPSHIMSLWYFIDEASFESFIRVNPVIYQVCYIIACTNSTFNPIVYGIFNLKPNTSMRGNTRTNTVRHGFSGESLIRRPVPVHSQLSCPNSTVPGNQSLTVYNNSSSKVNVSLLKEGNKLDETSINPIIHRNCKRSTPSTQSSSFV